MTFCLGPSASVPTLGVAPSSRAYQARVFRLESPCGLAGTVVFWLALAVSLSLAVSSRFWLGFRALLIVRDH